MSSRNTQHPPTCPHHTRQRVRITLNAYALVASAITGITLAGVVTWTAGIPITPILIVIPGSIVMITATAIITVLTTGRTIVWTYDINDCPHCHNTANQSQDTKTPPTR